MLNAQTSIPTPASGISRHSVERCGEDIAAIGGSVATQAEVTSIRRWTLEMVGACCAAWADAEQKGWSRPQDCSRRGVLTASLARAALRTSRPTRAHTPTGTRHAESSFKTALLCHRQHRGPGSLRALPTYSIGFTKGIVARAGNPPGVARPFIVSDRRTSRGASQNERPGRRHDVYAHFPGAGDKHSKHADAL